MAEVSAPQRLSGGIVAFVLIVALTVLLRLPLYLYPGLMLGWNSDTAIYGLMARSMVEHDRPILLFWGQDYLGTLTSFWTLVASLFVGEVGPLALRLGSSLQVAVSITLCWCVFRNLWGTAAANIAALWLIAGPKFFFDFSYAPLSAEQMLFVGAVILWYVTSAPMTAASNWLTLGLLTGIGWWAHRGALFAVLPFMVAHGIANRHLPGLHFLRCGLGFLVGAAVGVLPLIFGLASVDEYLYEPVTAQPTIARAFDRVAETLKVDLWRFLGAENELGAAAAILLLVLFGVGMCNIQWRLREISTVSVIAVSFVFWIASPQAYSGATRYLALALPVFLGVAGLGGMRLISTRNHVIRVVAVLSIALISVSYYHGRWTDVRDIEAGEREQYEHWPGGFDPRPTLEMINHAAYHACYADFWVAYKLEWLGRGGTQFIPYKSVNRTQMRSLRLAALPGPKCYVSNDGRVTVLTPEQDAFFRRATFDAVQRMQRRSAIPEG